MTAPTAPNCDLAYPEKRGNIDAPGHMVVVVFRVPSSIGREPTKAGMPDFGRRERGAH